MCVSCTLFVHRVVRSAAGLHTRQFAVSSIQYWVQRVGKNVGGADGLWRAIAGGRGDMREAGDREEVAERSLVRCIKGPWRNGSGMAYGP